MLQTIPRDGRIYLLAGLERLHRRVLRRRDRLAPNRDPRLSCTLRDVPRCRREGGDVSPWPRSRAAPPKAGPQLASAPQRPGRPSALEEAVALSRHLRRANGRAPAQGAPGPPGADESPGVARASPSGCHSLRVCRRAELPRGSSAFGGQGPHGEAPGG
jgi:hypothetical protein